MAQVYLQDFESESTGSPVADFTQIGANNSYQVLADASIEGSNLYGCTSSGAQHGWFYDSVNVPSSGDYEVSMRLISTTDGGGSIAVERIGVVGRAYDDAGTKKCYTMIIRNTNSLRLSYLANTGETTISTQTLTPSISDGTIYVVKMSLNGTAIKGKAWEYSGSEPGTWLVDTTSSTISNSEAGVGGYNWCNSYGVQLMDYLMAEDFTAGVVFVPKTLIIA